MTVILELRNLSKQFPGHCAVYEVSLDIPKGAFFSLLGPSGCGKTTLLRLIAGFEKPSDGRIFLDGQSIEHLPPYQRNVNTVFQNYALFPHLNVKDNIEFGLRSRFGWDRKTALPADAQERVSRVIEQVHLDGKEDRMPAQLSGGERQRVALARSLVLEPQVLLLDEPLSALDPVLRREVRAELKELQRSVGVTFLFVTHDQEEAMALSDRIALLKDGEIQQVGTPRELYERPRTPFIASFLGAIHWIDGVGLRPESLHISVERPPLHLCREAVVNRLVFMGPLVHVEVTLDNDQDIYVPVSPRYAKFWNGQCVHVWWDESNELRF